VNEAIKDYTNEPESINGWMKNVTPCSDQWTCPSSRPTLLRCMLLTCNDRHEENRYDDDDSLYDDDIDDDHKDKNDCRWWWWLHIE